MTSGITEIDLSGADPEDVRADLLDILDHLPKARILGPDEAGAVWLTGRTFKGLPLSLALGRGGDLIADAALGWRSRRELPY